MMCLRPAVPQQSRCQCAVVVQEFNYRSCLWREAGYSLASSPQGCHRGKQASTPGQFRVANFGAKEMFCNTLQESLRQITKNLQWFGTVPSQILKKKNKLVDGKESVNDMYPICRLD